MFGLGFTEILVVLTVALLVFGPKKLPEIARTLGKTMGELRRTLDEVKFEISEAELETRYQHSEKIPAESTENSAEKLVSVPSEIGDRENKEKEDNEKDEETNE